MSNKSTSIFFIVFALLYFGYTVFIAGHGIHWTNSIITIIAAALAIYYYLKGRAKRKEVKNMNITKNSLILGLALVLIAGMSIGYFLKPGAPTGYAPKTQTLDIKIGHQDSYAREALVKAGAPAETKIATFYKWQPSVLTVYKGDKVVLNVTNDSKSRVHSFFLPTFNVNTGEIPPKGETPPYQSTTVTVEFVADKAGVFQFGCGIPHDPTTDPKKCSPEHEYQTGSLIVLDR